MCCNPANGRVDIGESLAVKVLNVLNEMWSRQLTETNIPQEKYFFNFIIDSFVLSDNRLLTAHIFLCTCLHLSIQCEHIMETRLEKLIWFNNYLTFSKFSDLATTFSTRRSWLWRTSRTRRRPSTSTPTSTRSSMRGSSSSRQVLRWVLGKIMERGFLIFFSQKISVGDPW